MSGRRTAALAVAVTFLVGGCGSAGQVPSAADRVPRLGSLLKRLDADLAAHRYAAARADLHALKAAVAKARAAGQLDDAQATRVVDAVAQVMTAMPASGTTPSAAPRTSGSTPSAGPTSPTKSASSRPSRPRSTATTSSATPSAPASSAAPTAAPSPTASSSSTPTTQVSPAAASVTPSP